MPLEIELLLCDTNPAALEAWRQQFAERPGVEVHDCDFLDASADALIVPGNSFGFLDGGAGLRVGDRMGLELQDRLRARIRGEFCGELLVGQALIEDLTPSDPAIVYAPIWRTPQDISATVNVFLALKGAFQAIQAARRPALKRVAVPAVGLEKGCMHPYVSARQIRYAWEIARKERSRGGKNMTQLVKRERKMKAIPAAAREAERENERDSGAAREVEREEAASEE